MQEEVCDFHQMKIASVYNPHSSESNDLIVEENSSVDACNH